MKGAQRDIKCEEPNDELEIVDFRTTLTKCIEDEDKTYGQKNKPRKEEPSMFELLTWKDDEKALFNYTKKDKNVIDASVTNMLKYKINKSSSHWVTENMDQFRKFTYSPTKKVGFFDLEDPNKKIRPGTSSTVSGPKDLSEHIARVPKDQDVYVRELPKKASETIDKYTIQDLKNLKDVLKVVESRALSKGEVIGNPLAAKIAEQQHLYDEQEGGNQRREGGEDYQEEEQRQQDEDEESEEIEVEKLDLANVQSRLLTKKIKKAKELDPVYEKERLKRREDRIQRLNETTRWLSNSAFKTYFGKAPFENYGRGNLNPTVGGPIYGDYMKSHNVNPHSGDNKPEYKQVYEHADFVSTRYPVSQPEPPRKCKDDFRLSQNQVEELKRRNPLTAEKFTDKPKTIVKPDLVNALRFASEENTPDTSFEQEKKSKPKNLGESLKQLSKKANVIREGLKTNHSSKKQKKSSKSKKMQEEFRKTQEHIRESLKKEAIAKKEKETKAREASAAKSEGRKAHPQSEGKQVKTQARTGSDKYSEDHDIADEFNWAGQGTDSKRLRSPTKSETGASTANEQYSQRKGRNNASQAVKELMQDPPSAFEEKPRSKSRGTRAQETATKSAQKERPETAKSAKKGVSFKPAPEAQQQVNKPKEALKEVPVVNQPEEKHLIEYGKVEELPTLLKETQKNEKIWQKVNQDLNGALNVDPMAPPKNYLFSLAPKETDPRYYKNVPAVWMTRIPYAGRKNVKNEDIKDVFNY